MEIAPQTSAARKMKGKGERFGKYESCPYRHSSHSPPNKVQSIRVHGSQFLHCGSGKQTPYF